MTFEAFWIPDISTTTRCTICHLSLIELPSFIAGSQNAVGPLGRPPVCTTSSPCVGICTTGSYRIPKTSVLSTAWMDGQHRQFWLVLCSFSVISTLLLVQLFDCYMRSDQESDFHHPTGDTWATCVTS
uniref:DnaJ heat shock protein family (Hsp40) member C6 n=1 Tax=Rousettus aegyptiacus TaxID=9407 RepID=A0A7J8K765_ROUAE|nr:DnaJ heat shock protein family (Hsp40) member C6 [Rousettus aegyptiacus]